MTNAQFRALYDAYFSLVNASLRGYRLSAEEREDILQAVFFSYWIYSQTNHVDRPGGFLVTAARNRAISLLRLRATQRATSLEDRELPADAIPGGDFSLAKEQAAREERITRVRGALQDHASRTGDDTLWQRYAQGRKLKDIASTRGEPLGTVCSKVNVTRLPRRLVERLRLEMGTLAEAHG